MVETLRRNKYALIAVAVVLLLLGAWELIARIIGSSVVLPTFSSVATEFFGLFTTGTFYASLFSTLLRCLIGYCIGFVLGVALGISAGKSKGFSAAMRPINAVMRATPVAALVLLLYIWVGSNVLPSVIGIMLVFPIIYEHIKTATENIDPALCDVLDEMGSGFFHSARTVYLPLTLPHALSSVSATFGMNLKAVITAEVLASSVPSIGRQIYFANQNLVYDVSRLFAWVVVAVLLSVLFETILRSIITKLTNRISWLGIR